MVRVPERFGARQGVELFKQRRRDRAFDWEMAWAAPSTTVSRELYVYVKSMTSANVKTWVRIQLRDDDLEIECKGLLLSVAMRSRILSRAGRP